MNVEGNIERALFAHLDSFIPSEPITIVYPMMKFEPDGRPYAWVQHLPNTPQRMTINNGGIHRLQGILQVTFVFTPINGGLKPSPQIADIAGQLADHFKSGTVLPMAGGSVRITARPAVARTSITADRAEKPVSISWQTFI